MALMLWFAGAGCAFVSYAHGIMTEVEGSSGEPTCPLHEASLRGSHEAAIVVNHSATAVSDNTVVVANGHSCCKSQRPSANSSGNPMPASSASRLAVEILPKELDGLPAPTGAMSCCPLMSVAAAVVAKLRVNEATTALAESTPPALQHHTSTVSLSAPLRLPNRGHTYLRCCAFLI
jgi:hypothetical protein